MSRTDLSLAFTPLTLPNGQVLKNRIAKAAMEENMALASLFLSPSQQLIDLYKRWAEGGSGLIISGNVMIDYEAVGGVAPVTTSRELIDLVKKDDRAMRAFKDWTAAAKSDGAQFWLQLNHPGRQAFAPAASKIIGPSSTKAVDIGRLGKAFFSTQREMTEDDIVDAITRFAEGAQWAESINATGVQIHGAHGYLVSQFSSPLNNIRTDKWGGSLENRARFLFEVVRAIREVVSPSFAVSIKLNSADFQRGGFSHDDAAWVIQRLNELHVEKRGGLDLIEISGGNYESTAMGGNVKSENGSTMAREAYFLEFAHRIASISQIPIMVTGGINRADVVRQVVSPGPDQTEENVKTIAGIGTALALCPDLPKRLSGGEDPMPHLSSKSSIFLNKPLAFVGTLRQVQYSMRLISKGKRPSSNVSQLWALLIDQYYTFRGLRSYKKLVARIKKVELLGKADS